MSILFVLLFFLLTISITYFFKRPEEVPLAAVKIPETFAKTLMPTPVRLIAGGFDTPAGYCFHLGHTWTTDEGTGYARVGLDAFAVRMLGGIDRIEVVGLNRWVRQGQKLMTIVLHGGETVEVVSPVEGVVVSVNPQIIQNPDLMLQNPYRDGWVCVMKAPDLSTNIRNLVQGDAVAPWMRDTLGRLANLTQAAAADGGFPVYGVLGEVEPEQRHGLIHEFFLT